MSFMNEIIKQNIKRSGEKMVKPADSDVIDPKKLNDFIERDASFKIGDLIKVHYRIFEAKRERIQIFEGNVIAINGKSISKTFKVRKLSYGVGVERTFPVYSPNVQKIELVRHGKARRAKLYFLRARTGKSAMIKEKINFKEEKSK
jgi:large subunit ribosomal protein L19